MLDFFKNINSEFGLKYEWIETEHLKRERIESEQVLTIEIAKSLFIKRLLRILLSRLAAEILCWFITTSSFVQSTDTPR
jgi:hypothetical protein